VPPLVTATLEVAEQVHRKLMGIHRRLTGDPLRVSPKFSGKDPLGNPLKDHRHCFILPQDRDCNGWIDHLLIACSEPFDSDELRALYRLDSLWQRSGKPDIRCIPVQTGTLEEVSQPASRFTSATPFVAPRHYRKGRGSFISWLEDELKREVAHHDLPAPIRITSVANLMNLGRPLFWRDFRRNRRDDPIVPGFGFEMEFGEPVQRPIAVGYGCHFGLGQFLPVA